MPSPAHSLITFSGTFGAPGAPAETWQFGLKTDEFKFAADLPASPPLIAALWATHMAPLHPTFVHLTRVRVAQVDGLGHVQKTTAGAYIQSDWLGDNPGTFAYTSLLPPQVAVVVSLTTARSGATGKGRVFLPQTKAIVLATDFRMSQGDATDAATRLKALINGINGLGDAAKKVVVGSGGTKAGAPPVLSPVTGVRAGRAFDTHRSRRGDIPEGYVSLALT